MHSGKLIDEAGNYKVIACKQCGFKHLDPIPSEDDLIEFYSKQYFTSHKPDYINTDNNEEAFLRIAFEERHRNFQIGTKRISILDIGCGSGQFLNFLKEKGYKTYGVEPSLYASDIAKSNGHDVFTGSIDDFVQNCSKKFDVISLKNVLEHIRNPIEVIEYCKELMHKDSILFIEVPNDYSLEQICGVKLLNSTKKWICIPDHINYFNFKLLGRLLERNGLKVTARYTSFPMYLFHFLGYNFSKNPNKGRKLHQLQMNFELKSNDRLRRMIYKFLSFLHIGRTIIYYCKL
jgi:2-polyprenyl-3-methyl-5-hydroxy-6-metoxy-1,4-benzoquinol methylase